MKGLFDTNILVDYLNGIVDARDELGRYTDRAISIVTWMEVMVGCRGAEEEDRVRRFLASFSMVELNANVAERAVTLRQQAKLKLPDAIIQASAEVHNALLVTRNTKDFDPANPGIRVPYQVTP